MAFLTTILEYFFSPIPSGPFKYFIVLAAVASMAVAAGIALKILIKSQKEDKMFKKLFRALPGKLILFGVLEGIYVLVRFERIPYLSIRFLNYAIFAYGLYLAFHYIQLYVKIYPVEKKHREEQMQKNKYLPRKKK